MSVSILFFILLFIGFFCALSLYIVSRRTGDNFGACWALLMLFGVMLLCLRLCSWGVI